MKFDFNDCTIHRIAEPQAIAWGFVNLQEQKKNMKSTGYSFEKNKI